MATVRGFLTQVKSNLTEMAHALNKGDCVDDAKLTQELLVHVTDFHDHMEMQGFGDRFMPLVLEEGNEDNKNEEVSDEYVLSLS